MEYNDLSELIKSRRSCRNFAEKTINKELLYSIIDTAKNAPSACNSQPWKVYLTFTDDENAKMRECLQDNGRNKFLDTAKAFIAIYKKEGISLKSGTEIKFKNSRFVEYDIGEFIAYITLLAKDKGLDSCIIGWVNNDKLNESFLLKGECGVVVALGYAKEQETSEKKRNELKEIIINYQE